jgi:hypothetical protein
VTQHDAELLAQFASTWRMHKHELGLRACLRLDLSSFLKEHCLDFDQQAYWAMILQLDVEAEMSL